MPLQWLESTGFTDFPFAFTLFGDLSFNLVGCCDCFCCDDVCLMQEDLGVVCMTSGEVEGADDTGEHVEGVDWFDDDDGGDDVVVACSDVFFGDSLSLSLFRLSIKRFT